jgi:hypothetical protein
MKAWGLLLLFMLAPLAYAQSEYLDRISLEAALIVDRNDSVKAKLEADGPLRARLIAASPVEQLVLVRQLDRNYAPADQARTAAWDREYARFVDLHRNAPTESGARRAWLKTMVSTWSSPERRRIVARVLLERHHLQRDETQYNRLANDQTREAEVKGDMIGVLQRHARRSDAMATKFAETHTKWSSDEWWQLAGLGTALGGGLGLAAGVISSQLFGPWWITTLAVAAGVAGGMSVATAVVEQDRAQDVNGVVSRLRGQGHSARRQANQAQTDSREARRLSAVYRERAATAAAEARYHDRLLDAIPDARRWEPRPVPNVEETEPPFAGLERVNR